MVESRRILLVEGHPDPSPERLNHRLAEAYAEGAAASGHLVHRVAVGALDFPVLRSAKAWEHEPVPPSLKASQEALLWCEHLVLLFPLWMGDMPALLKAYLEQVVRPGSLMATDRQNPFAHKPLAGRSARVVVTMGMPALAYRWFYRAHSVRSLERNLLGFVGFAPIHTHLIGQVDGLGQRGVNRWAQRLRALGAQGT